MNPLREEKGYYNNFMRELEENDSEGFSGLMRMYPDFFHYLEHHLIPRNQDIGLACWPEVGSDTSAPHNWN